MRKFALLFIILMIFASCVDNKPETVQEDIPYPADEDMEYYQAQADSGIQAFWLDSKATASAFINNSIYATRGIRYSDIRIVGEGAVNCLVNINIGDSLLELSMERKYKGMGKKSIWQVIAANTKPWPKPASKSAR